MHLRKAAINIQLLEWEYAIDEYSLVLRHDSTNIAALFYRAYANNHLRRYELSINDYNALLCRLPHNLEARLGLANCYIKMNKLQDAMAQMNILVEQHPDSAIVYVARADLAKSQGYYDMSLLDWEMALRLKPKVIEYIVSKAEVYLLKGDKRKAKKTLDVALENGAHRYALREWYDKCK